MVSNYRMASSVYCDRSFVTNLCAGDLVKAPVPWPDLAVLSSATLTQLLKGDDLEELLINVSFKVSWACKGFRQLPYAQKLQCITRAGVYVATHKTSSLRQTLVEADIVYDPGDMPDWGEEEGEDEEVALDEGDQSDAGDDVHSIGTESDYDSGDELVAASVKRRRLVPLGRGPCFLPEGAVAVIPSAAGESRISRETGQTVYVYDWGSQTKKPNHLRVLTDVYRPGLRPVLFGFTSREDGTTYYAPREIFSSPSFLWLLFSAKTRSDAYSRVPLLLSPITGSLSVEGVHVS